MNITPALAPKSDQLDAIELVTPRTFTIDTGSRLGQRDGQAVAEIRLVGFDRVWRPSKGMLDVLAQCWGTDVTAWVGHSLTLYNDTSVMFGKEKTGGTRISHLSHIDGPKTLSIRASGAGRKKPWKVQPLTEEQPPPPPDYASLIISATTVDELRAIYTQAGQAGHMTADLDATIKARVAEVEQDTPAADEPGGE